MITMHILKHAATCFHTLQKIQRNVKERALRLIKVFNIMQMIIVCVLQGRKLLKTSNVYFDVLCIEYDNANHISTLNHIMSSMQAKSWLIKLSSFYPKVSTIYINYFYGIILSSITYRICKILSQIELIFHMKQYLEISYINIKYCFYSLCKTL